MLVGIDHLIIACLDPDAAAREMETALGLQATGGGRHEAHGTFNRLVWLGDSYIELMGVFDEELASKSWWGAHMLRVLAAGGGYAGMALASDALAADVARLRALGSAIADPMAGERVRGDGDVVRWAMGRLPVPDPELGLVFLIEHDTSAAEWRLADRQARARFEHPLGGTVSLIRVELPVDQTARATMRLLRDLGVQFRPSLAGAGARDTSIGHHILRLKAGREEPNIVMRGGTRALDAEWLGCRWQLIPA